MTRHLLTFLLLLIPAALPALGQPPKATRTCRILLLGAEENSPKSVYLHDGTTTQKVDLPSLNFSDVYQLAPGNIVLKLCSAPPTEDQPVPAAAPSAPVPDATTDCYLLVATDPKNPVVPLRFQVVDANPAGFRLGEMMWLNLTPYRVGGNLGSRTLNMKPNSQTIVSAPADGPGSYPVKIGYDPGNDKKPAMIVSTEWPHNPAGRNIVFVMMLPNSKIPRIKGYSDYREPPKGP
jgi:hypothetical protein